ncbi:MAG: regulatory iron-sulfur-containing complex subunit RicT, partial [Rikenellaceae bacterium]
AFISNFVSVTTNSARFQEILLNPQKLAGQCGKLKCCLNYEVDAYIDARKGFPKISEPLETIDGKYFLVKSDIFKKEMLFSTDPSVMANLVTISTERVWEVIKQNRKGIKVEKLDTTEVIEDKSPDYKNVVGEESITRFDTSKQNSRKGNSRRINGTERQGERSGDKRNRTPQRAPKPQQSAPSPQLVVEKTETKQPATTTPNTEKPTNSAGANRRGGNRRGYNRQRGERAKTETEGNKQ